MHIHVHAYICKYVHTYIHTYTLTFSIFSVHGWLDNICRWSKNMPGSGMICICATPHFIIYCLLQFPLLLLGSLMLRDKLFSMRSTRESRIQKFIGNNRRYEGHINCHEAWFPWAYMGLEVGTFFCSRLIESDGPSLGRRWQKTSSTV